MKTYIINLGLIFFLIIQVSAQTGSTVNDPATGLQFTVPVSGKSFPGKNQSILQLTFYSGEIYEYVLTEQDGKTYLDGYRYFRTYANSSVDSGRPNCF